MPQVTSKGAVHGPASVHGIAQTIIRIVRDLLADEHEGTSDAVARLVGDIVHQANEAARAGTYLAHPSTM
ncbi:hypothetical protein [Streptomyces sp. NPDC054863]